MPPSQPLLAFPKVDCVHLTLCLAAHKTLLPAAEKERGEGDQLSPRKRKPVASIHSSPLADKVRTTTDHVVRLDVSRPRSENAEY